MKGARRWPVNYRVKRVTFQVEVREPQALAPQVTSATMAAASARASGFFPGDAREHMIAMYFDSQNRLRYVHEVALGTLDRCSVSAREIVGPALRLMGMKGIVLVHNHPSGDPTPSPEDVAVTRVVAEAAALFELRLMDHIILGDGSEVFVSLRERGVSW